jgi:catechol 2,3-dioxygenase-like lactoylglutathione lyase family enzyme
MEMRLEVVPVPVTDVDRAKAFYVDQVGFVADHDHVVNPQLRFVQLTPPGSACSLGMGTGIPVYEAAPGSVRGLHLVVDDIGTARGELAGRGVDIGDVEDLGGVKYAAFSDPDGNTWTLQEMPWRTGDAF